LMRGLGIANCLRCNLITGEQPVVTICRRSCGEFVPVENRIGSLDERRAGEDIGGVWARASENR
jgi:hypothetical protein